MKGSEHEPLSDEALVRRALGAGLEPDRRAAAGQLLARYAGRVYRWCYRYVRDHERALELSQEVLLAAYRSLETYAERARFSSWIFAIARNRCVSALRCAAPWRGEPEDPDLLPDVRESPENVLERMEGEESILRLLRETLEPIEQRAIWLRCFEGLPVDEITTVLAIREASGARAVLQRARRKLRAALERRGRALEPGTDG